MADICQPGLFGLAHFSDITYSQEYTIQALTTGRAIGLTHLHLYELHLLLIRSLAGLRHAYQENEKMVPCGFNSKSDILYPKCLSRI